MENWKEQRLPFQNLPPLIADTGVKMKTLVTIWKSMNACKSS